MRFSTIRAGLLGLAGAAAIALAACGGHMVPTSSMPGAGMTALRPDAKATKSPCYVQNFWYFAGGCAVGQVTSKGGTYTVPPYKNIGLTVTLAPNSAKGKITFLLSDATGMKDITGTTAGHKWAGYSQKACASKNACPGTAMLYINAFNTSSSQTIQFKTGTNSALVVTSKTFPGKTCYPGLLSPQGWSSFAIVSGSPKGGKLTLTVPANPIFALAPGPAYIAIVCK